MNEFVYVCTAETDDEENLLVKTIAIPYAVYVPLFDRLRQCDLYDGPYDDLVYEDVITNNVFENYHPYKPTKKQVDAIHMMLCHMIAVGGELDNKTWNVFVFLFGKNKEAKLLVDVSGCRDVNKGLALIAEHIVSVWSKAGGEDVI